MIDILFSLLASVGPILGFAAVLLLSHSNIKFTKGELQKIIDNFVLGTILMFSAMFAQFQVEFFNLARTLIDVLKYIFIIYGFIFYLLASYEIHKLSKVLGFASKEMPEKLKKILKS